MVPVSAEGCEFLSVWEISCALSSSETTCTVGTVFTSKWILMTPVLRIRIQGQIRGMDPDPSIIEQK